MIPVIDNLDELPWNVRQAFEQVEVATGASWNRNHRGDGSHNEVVFRTLAMAEDGVLTPSQITINTNNFNPAGLSTAGVLRLSTDASRNLTGLLAPTSTNKYLDVWNIGAQNIVLVHESSLSLAQNRMRCPGAVNLTLNADDAITLWYDRLIMRWRARGV